MKLTLRQFFHQQLHGHFQAKIVLQQDESYSGARTLSRAFLEREEFHHSNEWWFTS